MKSVDNEEETEQVVLELFMCVVVLYQVNYYIVFLLSFFGYLYLLFYYIFLGSTLRFLCIQRRPNSVLLILGRLG